MSRSSFNGDRADFNLPEEILAVIPADPFDQLDLARKITSMAIASRVSNLEADVVSMKQKLDEKDRLIVDLQEKLSLLEEANREAESRLKITFDENMRLSRERDTLTTTVKKLGRDLAKLESFKRQLMLSLSDDNLSQTEIVDIGTCDQAVPRAYSENDENGYRASYSLKGSLDLGNTDEASRYAGQKFSITPYITPRLTPTGTPKTFSTSGSPKGYSAIASPKLTYGASSPTKASYEGRGWSSWNMSSKQSSAASSPPGRPPAGRGTRVDGKEFFRQARSRLSYEQFSAFLANIKELNAQKQSREETLRKAEEIFGMENNDLFLSFQGLLSRNVH